MSKQNLLRKICHIKKKFVVKALMSFVLLLTVGMLCNMDDAKFTVSAQSQDKKSDCGSQNSCGATTGNGWITVASIFGVTICYDKMFNMISIEAPGGFYGLLSDNGFHVALGGVQVNPPAFVSLADGTSFSPADTLEETIDQLQKIKAARDKLTSHMVNVPIFVSPCTQPSDAPIRSGKRQLPLVEKTDILPFKRPSCPMATSSPAPGNPPQQSFVRPNPQVESHGMNNFYRDSKSGVVNNVIPLVQPLIDPRLDDELHNNLPIESQQQDDFNDMFLYDLDFLEPNPLSSSLDKNEPLNGFGSEPGSPLAPLF